MPPTTQDVIKFWRDSGERNWKTASGLLELKRYDACLFFCHLTLEKILKGLVVQKIGQPAPYIHDLAKLANEAGLQLSDEQIQQLRTITTFNVAARYDDVKLAFYKKCTKAFTQQHFAVAHELYLWLKKQYLHS